MKVIGMIYEESDYSKFKRLYDNRDVTESRVEKLIASMSIKYILNPIVINENFEVIDGQGRFEARKALGLPIHYVLAEGATSDDCRLMNSVNSSWTVKDYVRSYQKKGLVAYDRVLKASEETKLTITQVLRLTNHSLNGTRYTDVIRNGKLIFTEEDMITAIDVKKHIDEILSALLFSGRINDAFLAGVKVMTEYDEYDPNRMIRKCEKQRATYSQMSRLEDQLKEFERIYNSGARAESKIYFSDYMRNKGEHVRSYDRGLNYWADEDISSLDTNLNFIGTRNDKRRKKIESK